jgi:hypothetical protein
MQPCGVAGPNRMAGIPEFANQNFGKMVLATVAPSVRSSEIINLKILFKLNLCCDIF